MQAPHAPQGNLSSSFRAMSDQRFGYTSPTSFLGGLILLCQTSIPSPTMHFCIVEVMQSLVQLGALGIPKIPPF